MITYITSTLTTEEEVWYGTFQKERRQRDSRWCLWHLVTVHKIDVDTLSREVRCVERKGTKDGMPVTFMRVFRLKEAAEKGVVVTGWETFDEHPELLLFEGYLTVQNQAFLERKRA